VVVPFDATRDRFVLVLCRFVDWWALHALIFAIVSLEKRLPKSARPQSPPAHTRGPHLRPPHRAQAGDIELRILTKDVLRKFISSTRLDPTRPPVSSREFKLHMLLLNIGDGLNCQLKGDRSYIVPTETIPGTERREAPPPKRGRPPIVPALAIAIRDLVDFVKPTNAAHILLVTGYCRSSEFPLIDMRGPDGNALIRRLANRLSRIAADQRSERGYPEPPG
jgi:hypothetical protein